jgi:hypothetical protein
MADQPLAPEPRRVLGRPAEHVGLLAPHHVRPAVGPLAAQARHDHDRRPLHVDPVQPGLQRSQTDGAVQIGDGLPAQVRADHAAGQGGQVFRPHLRAHGVVETLRRLAGSEFADPQWELLVGLHAAARADAPGAQVRSPPIQGEEGRSHAQV